jgi:hypothetical protein
MNESIARSRTRGSLRWREKTMMIDCSSTPDLSLYKSLSDEYKECSPEKLNEERMKSNLKTLRYTRKRLLYADKKKTTWWRNLQCTAEAW